MITGYNTDVRHKEVVFHVQTEDKGTSNPLIESLVYVGGQVLASKRAGYAELLAEGREEKEIVALMDHQHRTMIAAIRQGRLDEKLAVLLSGRQTGAHAAAAAVGATVPTDATGAAAASSSYPSMKPSALATPPAGLARATPVPAPVPPAPAPRPAAPAAVLAVPAPPPPRPAAPGSGERTLDQVILEYLTSEADQEQLVLLLEGEADLALGRRAALTLRTSSSKSGAPVAGAHVSVRMISTVTEPQVLYSGLTDDLGELPLLLQIPALNRGTAALIITAVSAIGRAEIKHLL
jgi:hypothetical protein